MKGKNWILWLPFLAAWACSDRGPQTRDDSAIMITGSTTVAPVVADAAKRFEAAHPGVRIEVQTGGSSRGIGDVKSGVADLGMVSRDLKAGEEDLTAHGIAIDGVALITHAQNPVTDLSREQVIQIYRKTITDWSEVGGSPGPIMVANKAEGTGTLEVFLKYTGLDSADIKPDVIVEGNQQAIKTIATNPRAIAYVSIGAALVEAAAGTPIRLLEADGVSPTPQSVAAGKFPITRQLNLVTAKNGLSGETAAQFLSYLKSDQIKDIIESHLYVPISK